MFRKLRISILAALLILAFTASQALAVPSMRFTLNGAREAYGPGSVFMLYGRAEDSGFGLPYSDVLVQVDSEDKSVLYSQAKADGNGYFRTNFNFPYSGIGSTFQVVTSTPESLLKQEYQLRDKVGLSFNCMGFRDKVTNQLVPLDTKEILLAFSSNVNYFYNKSADPDLKVLGRNEKNADCVRIYRKDTGKQVSTSARLISDDSEGDEQITFYKLDGTQTKETRKRILALSLNEQLAANTTYSVLINREMAANNSSILGQDKEIEFTTEKLSVSTGGGTISEKGVTIDVPEGAISTDIEVTVEKVKDTSTLPIASGSKFVSDVIEIIKDKTGNFSKPVAITLEFDKSKVDLNKYELSICWLDEDTNNWEMLDNVKVDAATGKVSGEAMHFTKFAIIATEKTSGSGGGKKTLLTEGTITKDGGTISESGVAINIPANAVANDIKVKVEKISTTTNLKVPTNSKLASDVVEITKDKAGDFKKPVTITLNFDKSKVDTAKYDLSLCRLDEKENKWVALENVKVELAAGKVSGEMTHFTKFAVIATLKAGVTERVDQQEPEQPINLKDITGHWAEQNIEELVASGAIKGYPDGTFQPDRTISRAEFAAILVKAFNLESKGGKVFNDTAGHWAKDAIAAAAEHGIVSGYSDTVFGPDDNITREQMAAMIVKAAKLQEAKEGKAFADSDKISSWARQAVATASHYKIIAGRPDNTFGPKDRASRAEAATVIVQALKQAA